MCQMMERCKNQSKRSLAALSCIFQPVISWLMELNTRFPGCFSSVTLETSLTILGSCFLPILSFMAMISSGVIQSSSSFLGEVGSGLFFLILGRERGLPLRGSNCLREIVFMVNFLGRAGSTAAGCCLESGCRYLWEWQLWKASCLLAYLCHESSAGSDALRVSNDAWWSASAGCECTGRHWQITCYARWLSSLRLKRRFSMSLRSPILQAILSHDVAAEALSRAGGGVQAGFPPHGRQRRREGFSERAHQYNEKVWV